MGLFQYLLHIHNRRAGVPYNSRILPWDQDTEEFWGRKTYFKVASNYINMQVSACHLFPAIKMPRQL